MFRRILRFLLGILIGLGIGIGVLSLLAYMMRDRIWQWAQSQLSATFSARIVLKDFSVNGWRGFPALQVNLYGLSLITFEGETLFTSQKLSFYLNFYEALIKKRYRIMGVRAESPHLRLRWNKKGQSAWASISRFSGDTTAISWRIEKIALQDARFSYIDQKSRIFLIIGGVNLKASLSHTPHSDTTWQFEARLQALLERLSTPTTPNIGSFPIYLNVQGAILEAPHRLLLKNVSGNFSAIKAILSGHLQWKPAPLYVSLGLARLDIDFARLSQIWPRLPSQWRDWPGLIAAGGTVQGFIGQGHLPTLNLKATLNQRKPFRINGYDLQNLYARVRLHWHPLTEKANFFVIDSLYLRGLEDSLAGRGAYIFPTQTWEGSVQGTFHLPTLRMIGLEGLGGKIQGQAELRIAPQGWEVRVRGRLDSISYDTLALAWYVGELRLGEHSGHWRVEAKGDLGGLSYAPFGIDRAELQWTPEVLTLRQIQGQYEKLSFRAPILSLRPAVEPWRQKDLFLAGQIDWPLLPFPPPLPAENNSPSANLPSIHLDLRISADTVIWQSRRYGPLRASLQTRSDTIKFDLDYLGGFARGSLEGTLQKSSRQAYTQWDLRVKAKALHISALRADLPVLDSLLPLMPHLQGEVSAVMSATLPISQERLLWAQALADADIQLRDFVVRESPYTYKLFSIVPLTDFKRIAVGAVAAHLSLRDGVIRLDTTLLRANEWRLWVSGSHTLKNDLSYNLLVEVPRNLLFKSSSQVSDVVEEVEGERLRLAIRVTGKADNPTFHWQIASKKGEKSRKLKFIEDSPQESLKDSLSVGPPKGRRQRVRPPLPVEESPR